jgi:hypothetical protein
MFRCPSCSKFTELLPEESLVITGDDPNDPALSGSHYICKECKAKLNHETKVDWLANKFNGGTGSWEPTVKGMTARGFWIPQLYSMTIEPVRLAKAVLEARLSPAKEQELHNSKYGLPHTVKGSRVTEAHINACISGYTRMDTLNQGGLVTMGVDVGTQLHVEVNQWFRKKYGSDISTYYTPKVIYFNTVSDFEHLDDLIKRFGVLFTVIDANPERRLAIQLANRHVGRVRLCFYGNNITGKTIDVKATEPTITVDRTNWLDVSMGRFKNQDILLPADITMEYRTHIRALVRTYESDMLGNPVGRYVTTQDKKSKAKKPDHFAHARTYNELALVMATSLGTSQDIQ